jgi:hypothetical protein
MGCIMFSHASAKTNPHCETDVELIYAYTCTDEVHETLLQQLRAFSESYNVTSVREIAPQKSTTKYKQWRKTHGDAIVNALRFAKDRLSVKEKTSNMLAPTS